MPRPTDKKPMYSFDVDLFTLNDVSVYLGYGPIDVRGHDRIQTTEATTKPGALGNVITRIGAPRYAQRKLSKEPYISRIVSLSVPQQPGLTNENATLYSETRHEQKVGALGQLPLQI